MPPCDGGGKASFIGGQFLDIHMLLRLIATVGLAFSTFRQASDKLTVVFINFIFHYISSFYKEVIKLSIIYQPIKHIEGMRAIPVA